MNRFTKCLRTLPLLPTGYSNCDNLEEVVLSDNLKSIDAYGFAECPGGIEMSQYKGERKVSVSEDKGSG